MPHCCPHPEVFAPFPYGTGLLLVSMLGLNPSAAQALHQEPQLVFSQVGYEIFCSELKPMFK